MNTSSERNLARLLRQPAVEFCKVINHMADQRDKLVVPIQLADIVLSGRARKVCQRKGITTLDELAAETGDAMLEERGCGEGTYCELRGVLRKHGLQFREEP